MTVDTYLSQAVKRIDTEFGKGFAKKNPGLVGAFIQAAASDFNYAVLAQQIRVGLESIAEHLREPEIDMEPIKEGLDNIAKAIDDTVSSK
jgi:hypothetical protein